MNPTVAIFFLALAILGSHAAGAAKPNILLILGEDRAPIRQLLDHSDPGETKSLHAANPDVVKELKVLLEQSKASGRSRPVSKP